MRIKLVKSDGMDDWYTIERVDHEHYETWHDVGINASRLYDSARIADACVEGNAFEMRGIAKAIIAKGSYHAKRCAVRYLPDDGTTGFSEFLFWSPRNSEMRGVTEEWNATEFAHEALKILGDES